MIRIPTRFPDPARAGGALMLTLVAAAGAAAQDRAADEAKAILAKIDAARGGPSGAPASLALEGTFSISIDGVADGEPVIQGRFTEIFAGGTRARHTADMGENGLFERGMTEEMVWEIDPVTGPKIHGTENAALLRRYFGLVAGAPSGTLYRSTRNAGVKEMNSQANVVLTMVPASGREDTWFVEAATGRITCIHIVLPRTDGEDLVWGMGREAESTLDFEEWKIVDGVEIPHRRTLHMGPVKWAFVVTKATIGGTIPAERFAPPESAAKAKGKVVASPPAPGEAPSYRVLERDAQPFAGIRLTCKTAEVGATIAVLLPEVMAHLYATGAGVAGVPFLRYHKTGDSEVEIETGFPVAKRIEEKGRIRNGELPGGRTIVGWHVGPYEGLPAAHSALAAYAAENRLKPRGGSWEVYWTDPGVVPDPSKWRTQLFLPVED